MESIVSGVAGRYALSLFQLARETGKVDAVAADLDRFAALITESADLRQLIESPIFSAKQQEKAVAAVVAKAGIGGYVGNFIRLVAAKRRLSALPDMIGAYRDLAASAKGIARAEIKMAQKPSEAMLKQVEALLSDSLKTQVAADLTVDPSLIGGIVIKVGSRMVDASVRAKLNSIRLAMKEVR